MLMQLHVVRLGAWHAVPSACCTAYPDVASLMFDLLIGKKHGHKVSFKAADQASNIVHKCMGQQKSKVYRVTGNVAPATQPGGVELCLQ